MFVVETTKQIIQMSKSKSKYDTRQVLLVKELAKKYEVSTSFVRMAINADRTSETATTIKKEYNDLYQKLSTVLN